MDVDDYEPMAIAGTILGEVFAVFIKPHAGECEVYGGIQVYDDEGTIYFYDLEPESALTISSSSPSQSLLLSNSDRAILARRHFTVNLDLKEKNGGNEFIRGSFSWNAATDGRYDVVLDKNIEGKLGSATVYYTVHRVALEATIGAEFTLRETMSSGMHVHGKFVARYKDRFHFNGKDLEGRYEFTLFEGSLADVKDGGIYFLLIGLL